MTITTTKKLLGVAAAAGMIVALAGCGSAPTADPTKSGGAGGAVEGFMPCIVSGVGAGFEDNSFNELGLQGLTEAAEELGVEYKSVVSVATTDFENNIQSLIDEGCTLITTVGFDQAAATLAKAGENPEVQFVIIDDVADGPDEDFDGPDEPNIKPVIFDTAQAAFLAGYASASYSKSKVLGTFGGAPYPTVSIFMDGFKQGADYWNKQKNDTVKVVGWGDGTDGLFTGKFVPNADALKASNDLIGEGADVILPVGGSIYESTVSAIEDSGKDIAMLGVDADFFVTDPDIGPLVLTSILKAVDVGVKDAVLAAGKGDFDATPFIGTLENNGVGIAPFHDFESKVSADLQGELDEITAGIIDGSITVKSYLNG